MSLYRHDLPQLREPAPLFMTDGGLETTLIYQDGLDLPHFAAFDLLDRPDGRAVLRRYFMRYAELAASLGLGVVLESPTWRANPDWAERLGYDSEALAEANRKGVGLLLEVRAARARGDAPIVVSATLGPRGDGYLPGRSMSVEQARNYHGAQIGVFAQTDADLVSAFTINYVDEAVGITLSARDHRMPIVISFTLETDGRLPSGASLRHAIEQTDEATGGYVSYFMINCAHPEHFFGVLDGDEPWMRRLRGVRANASRRSHAELDAATEIDSGDPQELGEAYVRLRSRAPCLNVVGGCCGTDDRHVRAICQALLPRLQGPEATGRPEVDAP